MALEYLDNLDRKPVNATVNAATLRQRMDRPLLEEGAAPDQVLSDLVHDVEGGILGCAGPRFFGWVIGGSLPAALAADWMTSTWDQNAGMYATSPAASVAEEISGKWLKEILGLPAHASFAFTTGCQMAHATCLAAARHALLEKRGWDVEQKGLFGAPPIRILTSSEAHGSFKRAVRLLGFGMGQIEYLAADDQGRLAPDTLASALDETTATIVLLQAGDLNIGAFDDFEALIPIAKRSGAWVHVDGAFGLWAAASPRLRHFLKGVEQADSWATDGHKWLNVPYDCGYAFVADVEGHRASMSHRASYLVHDAEARDQLDWNPEFSRRARGFPTYAALRQLGRNGIAEMVERCCRLAHDLVVGIGTLRGAQVFWEPSIDQGLVRFCDPAPDATEQDHDRRTDEVIAAIVAEGVAFFGGTTWRGRRAMRVSVCNWMTSDEDVRRTIHSVAKVLSA